MQISVLSDMLRELLCQWKMFACVLAEILLSVSLSQSKVSSYVRREKDVQKEKEEQGVGQLQRMDRNPQSNL